MTKQIHADVAVIGAGSGGLSVAAGAAQMGAKVVLIEKGKMGGDCLNYGCVPSKSLLAAAHAANTTRAGARFGVNGHEPAVDFAKVHAHVHGVIDGIAPNDSVERFEGLGVEVIQSTARFASPREVETGGLRVRARRFVIATGSYAAIPPIPGIDTVPVLTNETIFDLTDRPEHLIVVGGGPIGVEMAQAHRRLGSKVTLLEALTILPKDDPDAAAVVRDRLLTEGIEIHEQARIQSIGPKGNRIEVAIEDEAGAQRRVVGTHLLVAAGRRPNIEGLGLEAAGIHHSQSGITVDKRLRTSNRRVFAIGDVAGGLQFTHVAGYHAGIVIRNALFRIPAKANHDAVPWVTYSDPELAQVGLTERTARERWGDKVRVLTWPFEDNDRARAERATEGFIKAMVGPGGRILGATIVGAHAGELILPWVLAVDRGLKVGEMASIVAPYPTLSEVSKRVAGSYYTDALFGPRTRWLVRWLAKLG